MANGHVELITDVWDTIVSYIPSKDKLAAAEALIAVCDEFGFTKTDFYDIIDDNKILETAFSRYFAGEQDDEDDDDWE